MLTPTSATNLDGYGNAPLDWDRIVANLEGTQTTEHLSIVLGTVRPDGRPHAAGVGSLWIDGAPYVVSGPETQKSRNLAANPACTLAAHLATVDLVIDGEAMRVTDSAELERVAAAYREAGWPAERDGDALTAPFSAPSAGPPPWYVYRIEPRQIVAVALAEPNGATRWRFDL